MISQREEVTFLEDVQDGRWESGGVLWDGNLSVRAEDVFPSWGMELKGQGLGG